MRAEQGELGFWLIECTNGACPSNQLTEGTSNMKITENADGTYTLDPRPGLAGWDEMVEAKDRTINELRAELKASREAHHKTTDELRKLKMAQAAEPEPDFNSLLRTAMEGLFGPSPRKK